MLKEITCLLCPKGCELSVEVDKEKIISVEYNKCPKGIVFAEEEILHPKRILCTTVKTTDPCNRMLPVRTDGLIPLERITEAMEIINNVLLDRSVRIGETIIDNLLDLGISVTASRSLTIVSKQPKNNAI